MSTPVLQFTPGGDGIYVDLVKLVASRMLIQGSSGAGKSWLIRYILEQTYGRIQQFVFDPEGEFVTLRSHRDYVVASAGPDGDVPAHPSTAALLCRQLVQLQASAILDIYELDPEEREEFVGNFLRQLLNMPKDQWRSGLVVMDEAHEFAPQAGQPPSRKPVELLVSKGRKRGLGSIFATQRVSKLSKNASDMQNILVGLTGLDVDVKRAGELLGFDKDQREELKRLQEGRGEFFAFGPAISQTVVKVRSGDVQSHHPKPGEVIPPTPPASGALAELIAQMAAVPATAEEEESEGDGAPAAVRVGPSEQEILTRIRAAEARTRTEMETVAAQRVTAAIDELRTDLRPHVLALYHSLANGSSAPTAPAEVANNAFTPGVKSHQESHQSPEPPERAAAAPPRPRRAAPAAKPPAMLEGKPILDAWQRILDASASLAAVGIKTPSRKNVAVFARMSPKSSAYDGHIAKMVQAGVLEYPSDGHVALTAEGKKLGRPNFKPKSVDELHEAWFAYLADAQVRILRPLLGIYPKGLSRTDLGLKANQSSKSSAFDGHIADLASLGLVRYPQDRHVAATELLFPAGLR